MSDTFEWMNRTCQYEKAFTGKPDKNNIRPTAQALTLPCYKDNGTTQIRGLTGETIVKNNVYCIKYKPDTIVVGDKVDGLLVSDAIDILGADKEYFWTEVIV